MLCDRGQACVYLWAAGSSCRVFQGTHRAGLEASGVESPRAWVPGRLGQGGPHQTNCTLPSGAAVVTAPGSWQEARGPGELITVSCLPPCPC